MRFLFLSDLSYSPDLAPTLMSTRMGGARACTLMHESQRYRNKAGGLYQRWSQGHKARGQGQGQGQPLRGQTLLRPRTGMLKGQGQGHKRKCSPKKKKKVFTKVFLAISKKKKVFTKIFLAISTKKRFPKNFSSASQNFNNSKNSAVLELRTGQFSRT